jgi:triosephosphate isomerase
LGLYRDVNLMKKIVAGNWKMNLNKADALELADALISKKNQDFNAEIIVCPSFPWIPHLADKLKPHGIMIGAQNCAAQSSGAFTGEVSAAMIASAGGTCVILGHSERRALFGDTDVIILEKCKQALNAGLRIILCCGETLEERENGYVEEVIRRQLAAVVPQIALASEEMLIIAYEPVWAIGTGKTASPEEAEEVHIFIRHLLCEFLGESRGIQVPILYGGSCNASNAEGLFARKEVNGGLIGGASLKAEDFFRIVRAC